MRKCSCLATVLLSFAIPLVAAPEDTPNQPEVLTRAIPPPSPEAMKGVRYEDVTAASGLGQFRHIAGEPLKPYLPETTGSGLALLDYDNDGWVDIYFVNSLTHAARKGKEKALPSALFRNNGDGTFSNVTAQAGVENNRWGTGVCAGDYDNDGWADLYVVNLGKSRLYRNNGDGSFTDIAPKAGVQVDLWATGCAFGDYDRDGLLDLYVAGYVDFDWDNPPPAGESSEGIENENSPRQRSPSRALAPSEVDDRGGMGGAAYDPGQPFCTFLGMRVACGPLGMKGAPDFLFRNNGDGAFTDVTRKAGVADKHLYYGFAVGWVDLDDDGWLDLVVANDSNPNYVYHSQGDGTFAEIGYLSGLGTNADGRAQAYMGMAVGDYNHDGRTDFFFTTFSNDSYSLYLNKGNLDFNDVTQVAGLGTITIPFLGWGTQFLDYDNDGWLDILAANGHVYPQVDEHSRFTSFRQRTLLVRNLHNNKFVDVTGSLGSGIVKPKSSRGAVVGDLFNDGDLDIVLINVDEPPTLLRNRGGSSAGNWISLQLIGDPAKQTPRDAIGSVVFCEAGGFRQRGEVASGRSYVSQSDLRVHFGLGAAERVDKLEIRWSNGKSETVAIPTVNRSYTVRQGEGIRK
ncbi:MAG: CRTAC1 family protein [Acidobacteria bacterium]|nr:CRTAC1 family protein [Acidobacteriota bacterium]